MATIMNPQEFDASFDAKPDMANDPEFRRILADLLESVAGGEPAAFDRYAKQYPRYAPALLQAALYAVPIEARMRIEAAPEHDSAAAAGISAAMSSLGISPPKTVLDSRKALGWSLGDLARRLLLPDRIALKIERGQIATWPIRLTEKLAEALETTQEYADAVLTETAGNFRTTAAAFSAEGDPEVATVGQRRQETLDFDEALSMERLTPEQAAYWKAGQ